MITASSPPQSLGRAFGAHRALDTAGAVIGPLVAFAILATLPSDYRSVFIVSFAAAAVGLAILLLVVPDLRPRQRIAARRQPGLRAPASAPRPSLRLLANRRFALLTVAAGVLGVLTIGDGFLYLALQHRDDLAIRYFPLLYVGTNFAYMLLAVPFGRIADRIGRARVFIGGHIALLLAYLCAGGPASGPVLTLCCLALLGMYYAATDGVLAALSSRLADPATRASGIATVQTVQAAARFFSSIAFGLLWTFAGQRAALLIVAAILLLALPVAWLLLPGPAQQDNASEPAKA